VKYLILVLFSLLLFINNDSLALWEQDEAAYAGFAYNMVEREQYLIPDFELQKEYNTISKEYNMVLNYLNKNVTAKIFSKLMEGDL
jgi:hypothetical protein